MALMDNKYETQHNTEFRPDKNLGRVRIVKLNSNSHKIRKRLIAENQKDILHFLDLPSSLEAASNKSESMRRGCFLLSINHADLKEMLYKNSMHWNLYKVDQVTLNHPEEILYKTRPGYHDKKELNPVNKLGIF